MRTITTKDEFISSYLESHGLNKTFYMVVGIKQKKKKFLCLSCGVARWQDNLLDAFTYKGIWLSSISANDGIADSKRIYGSIDSMDSYEVIRVRSTRNYSPNLPQCYY